MKYLAAMLGAALCVPLPADAQELVRPPWLVACSNQSDASVLVCEISQSIVLTEGNRRVATVALLKQAGEDSVMGVFTLPVGLSLPEGLQVEVDEVVLGSLPYSSCDGQGCYVNAAVEPEWVDAIRSGSQLTLKIARGDGEIISFGFDMTGFDAVFGIMP